MAIRVLLALLLCAARPCLSAESAAEFQLQDHLNRQWSHEIVFFPVPAELFGRNDIALSGPGGKTLAHQWVPAGLAPSGRPSVAFLADVAPFSSSTYRLIPGQPRADTDLRVARGEDEVRIENGLTGIRLSARGEALRAGPIAGIRLLSGRWVAGGKLTAPEPAARVSTEVACEGPIFAQAEMTYSWADGKTWKLRFRVVAGEPVVLVDEICALPEGSKYSLELGKGWSPTAMFHRGMVSDSKALALADARGDPLFVLEPWPAWWGEQARGNWVSFYRDDSDDLLVIGCREPGIWVDPATTKWSTEIPIGRENAAAELQLRGPARKWTLAAMKKSGAISDKAGVAPPPQRLLIRHGDLALDKIKDYALDWPTERSRSSRLLMTPRELERFRQSYRPDAAAIARIGKNRIQNWDEAIAAFLATGDEAINRRLVELATETVQRAVDRFVMQDTLRSHGTAPHHRTSEIMSSAILADLVLDSPGIKPEERRRLRAQLAYLAYTLSDPAFISPERGFRANPNMTTTARGMLGMVACAIATHPQSRNWALLALKEVKHELEEWCDEEGGWLEAPHYMTVSIDSIIGLALALRGTGFSDVEWEFHPKLGKAVQWLAMIATPPDPRLNGDRHDPEIGNTYLGERTCLPGWMARIWRDRDPEFASHMQWAWKAQGCFRSPGIGGAYPATSGYKVAMFDETIEPKAPLWGTHLFPDTGAVFRSHFPGDRETYLHYIQGRLHQHYDYDEGSFVLWGKGQPLCEDFGYYGRAPASDHSRVDDGFQEALGNEGRIREFHAGTADYLRGERAGWQRQILFAKDPDPLGPNFFAIRDVTPRASHWRVWIAASEAPDVSANPIRAKGRFGADLVVYVARPAKPILGTERLTRKTGASGFNTKETTQDCLHMQLAPGEPSLALLYPVLKDQPTPRFASIAEGRVVRVDSAIGTDYVLLSLEPFHFEGEGILFDGTAGVVQVRGRENRLSLPAKGTLSRAGKSVRK